MMNVSQLSRVDLNLLTLFQAVMEEGHVGRAASRMNVTTSAVSHGLRRLRAMLNDPLFLRIPKGVVPTARALDLAPAIADTLSRAAAVISSAAPFDPASSRRRFVIGAPDAVLASTVAPRLNEIAAAAPYVNFGLLHLLPGCGGEVEPWSHCLAQLERRELDVAILPISAPPPRFSARSLYCEDFVVGMRKGHPFANAPTLTAFCAAQHVLVSMSGEPFGFVDDLLAKRKRARRIAVTVPTFMLALAQISDSDFLSVLPRRLVERYGSLFMLTSAELPLKRSPDDLTAVASKAALLDTGLAWLIDAIANGSAQQRSAP